MLARLHNLVTEIKSVTHDSRRYGDAERVKKDLFLKVIRRIDYHKALICTRIYYPT